MSKMDDMRAMREARFGQVEPRVAGTPAAPERAAAPKRAKPTRTPVDSDGATDSGDSAGRRCGHRAISGRSCTRPHGHAEKSHRYS